MSKTSNESMIESAKTVSDFYAQSFDQLSKFYEASFDQIITVIGWGGGAIVVLVPIASTWYQNRLSKIESREIENSLDKKMQEKTKELEKKLSEEFKILFEQEKKSLLEKLDNCRAEDDKKISSLNGKISSLKAVFAKDDIQCQIFWTCSAAQNFIWAEDHASLSIQLNFLEMQLSTLSKAQDTTTRALANLIKALKANDKLDKIYFSSLITFESKLRDLTK